MVLTDLPIAIPKSEFIGTPTAQFPYHFYGYQKLAGTTADRCRLSVSANIILAQDLGNFLQVLHRLPLDQVLAAGIGYDQMQRVHPCHQFVLAQERANYLIAHKIIANANPWLDFFIRWQSMMIDDVWVIGHGDLYAKHIMLDDQHRLSGVIDWGDAEIIHSAVDLAIVYQMIEPDNQHYFWQNYGEVTENTQLLAKLRAIYSAITMAWYAHQVQDHYLLNSALRSLDLIAKIL